MNHRLLNSVKPTTPTVIVFSCFHRLKIGDLVKMHAPPLLDVPSARRARARMAQRHVCIFNTRAQARAFRQDLVSRMTFYVAKKGRDGFCVVLGPIDIDA